MAEHDWSELDALLKHHYETGMFGGCHFQVPGSLLAAIRERNGLPPRELEPVWMRSPERLVQQLMSIPVVVDDTLPAGEWRLVDNASKEERRCGSTLTVLAEPVMLPPNALEVQDRPAAHRG